MDVIVVVVLLAVVFEVDWVHAVTSARVVILVNRNAHFLLSYSFPRLSFYMLLVYGSFLKEA